MVRDTGGAKRLLTRQSFAEFVQWLAIFEAAPEILNYDRVVAEYSHTFDNRVTVLPYELLHNDSRAFLAIIEAVLGIDAHPASPLRENVRLSADELHWYPRIAHAIERLPLGDRVRRRLLGAHRRGISSGRMRSMVRMLSRLKAGVEDGPSTVPDDVLERVRGGATKLVTRQWHRPYAAEYLG
jgi:hypothetical protein